MYIYLIRNPTHNVVHFLGAVSVYRALYTGYISCIPIILSCESHKQTNDMLHTRSRNLSLLIVK